MTIGIGVGIAIAIGVLLGAAIGSFARIPAIAWRTPVAAVDTLAPWRDHSIAGQRLVSATSEPDLLPPTADSAICRNCSDYERGYAWAEQAGVASTAECESYSWSYQRGCIAWLRSGRRSAASSHP